VCCCKFRIRCRSCFVCCEFEIRCQNWVVCSELTFAAELGFLQRIWELLLKLSCLQRIKICCWIVSALAKLNCLQWICNSLSKLSSWQQINIWFVFPAVILGYDAKILWQQWIWNSLPKLSYVQWINICCLIVCAASKLGFGVEVEWSEIRCRNWVVCSELTLGPQLRVLLQIWDSFSKMSWAQRINIRFRIVCVAANLGFAAEVVLSVVN